MRREPAIEENWIDRLLSRFLPRELAEDDLRARPRALLLLRFTLLGALLTLLLFPYFAIHLDRAFTGWMNLIYGAALVGTPLVLRRSRSVEFASHWALTSAMIVLLVECWIPGGATSRSYPWLAILPVGGMLLSGTRGGAWWGLISTSAVVGIGILHGLGMIPSAPSLPESDLLEIVISTTALNVALAALGWLSESRAQDLMSHLESERAHFRERSVRDPLTGLANRSLLLECLLRSRERCRRHGLRAALFFIDLDGFKAINDARGHVIGDLVLIEVASRLNSVLRRSDLAGRLGGDEFAVIVEGLNGGRETAALAKKLSRSIEAPFDPGDGPVDIGASIGIAFYSGEEIESLAASHAAGRDRNSLPYPPATDPDDVERIVKRADAAMYRAKRNRQRFAVEWDEA